MPGGAAGRRAQEAAAIREDAERQARGRFFRAEAWLERAEAGLNYPESYERDDTEAMNALRQNVDAAKAEFDAARAEVIALYDDRPMPLWAENMAGRDIEEEREMLQDAMRTAGPEPQEDVNPNVVSAAHEAVSKARNAKAERDEDAAQDLSYEERGREADRDRDRAPSRRRDPYSAALDNELSHPATDGLTEVEKEFERLMFKDSQFWRLCWELDDETGDFFRDYVTMEEAEKAFKDGSRIGDGGNIQGETNKCILRGVPVVIKRHILNGEGAYKGYRRDYRADPLRFQQAKTEDENHRFIWNSLYVRGYRKLAAKLAYPACMDFSERSPDGFWYTVQTLVDAGPNVRAYALVDFVQRFGKNNMNVLTMAQRSSLAWQYGTLTAAFHTAGVFHHDLHWGNMLVLWPIDGANENTDPELRIIDWGMASEGGVKFVKNNGKFVPCEFPEITHGDEQWIEDDLDYDDLDNFPPRPGITVEDDGRDKPEHFRVRNYRREILDQNGNSMTPKRFCISERMLGPWAIWMDVDKKDKYYLIKRVVVAYKTFLTKDAYRLAAELAKAGHYLAAVKTRRRTQIEQAEAASSSANRGSICSVM